LIRLLGEFAPKIEAGTIHGALSAPAAVARKKSRRVALFGFSLIYSALL